MSSLAISEITTAEWDFSEDVAAYAEIEAVDGIGIWRDKIESVGVENAAAMLDEHDLEAASLTYAGGFVEDFEEAVADGKQALRDAATLGAPVLLILGGPRLGIDAAKGDRRVRDALDALAPVAEETGVTLGVEPIHPMQVTVFSTVVTLDQARELVADVPNAGVVFDTWNTWWDPEIDDAIARAGEDIAAVHVADWQHPTDDPSDRAPPGEGVAPLDGLLSTVEKTGYDDWYEIELFTERYGPDEYDSLLETCIAGTRPLLPE